MAPTKDRDSADRDTEASSLKNRVRSSALHRRKGRAYAKTRFVPRFAKLVYVEVCRTRAYCRA